jgi:hypothetical protein
MAIACKERVEERIGKIPVVERLLIYIKHNLSFLWSVIEWINDLLFALIYSGKLEKLLSRVFIEFEASPVSYRRLSYSDIGSLHQLINGQPMNDLDYFRPHGFEIDELLKQSKKRAFLMMGAFDGEAMVGYFFLRFFINRRCFVGRLIDKPYRGKGIGEAMNQIMYELAWKMKFRCLSTISKYNTQVIKAHAKNKTMIILKELKEDYLLVEFVRERNVAEKTV